MKYDEMRKRLMPIAEVLGIDSILDKFPYEVSGGQKQRVAIARALITSPQLILADEPTGALDSKSSDDLLQVFEKIHQEGQTIIMVTHSVAAASRAQRVLFIKDGKVYHELERQGFSSDEMYEQITQTQTKLLMGGGIYE